MLKLSLELSQRLVFKCYQKHFGMENFSKRTLRSKTIDKTVSQSIEPKSNPSNLKVKTGSIKKSPSERKLKIQKESNVKTEVAIKSEYFENQHNPFKTETLTESSSVTNIETSRKRSAKNKKEDTSIKPEKIKKEPNDVTGSEDLSLKPNDREEVVDPLKTELLSDFPHVTDVKGSRKRSAKNVNAKPEKAIKVKKEPETVPDIEDAVWKPKNWEEVLENVLKMRKLHVAPVDSLGCEECPEDGAPPEVFRYQTLISVMLSSQTRDEVTYAATQRLIEHGLTVESILNTADETIEQLIYPAGFYKSKVKFIKRTSQILKDQYNGDIPRTFKELCKLPGVGPKMANIVMSVAWNDTVGIAVDTHVHRISNRLGWVPKPTKDPEQTRKALESWLPKDQWRPINLTLVGFGQTVCRPIGPACETCLNKNLCPFGRSNVSSKGKKKMKSDI